MPDIQFCGSMYPALDLPDAGEGACCAGSACQGPDHCTCWVEEHDVGQQPPQTDLLPLPAVPIAMCPDCAFRPNSPERIGDPGYQGNADSLDELVDTGAPFWCHQGMRKVAQLRHPSGATVDGHPAAYAPLIVGNVPYKADGTPANVCAGWMLRRLKTVQTADQEASGG